MLTLVCLASLALAQEQSYRQYENAAARVLGPHWRQVARDSGMIFSGTVLDVQLPRSGDPGVIPVVEIRFRVERAIAGVQNSQILTIREWAGAWPQRPLVVGQQALLFLYPPSRLGLTSPVGGSRGQVAMKGKNKVLPPAWIAAGEKAAPELVAAMPISLTQLERAIRSARGPERTAARRGGAAGGEE